MPRPLSEKSIRSLVTAVSHAKEFNQSCNHVLMLIYVICAQFNGLCDLFIGASLSEPHTSGTALWKCVNIHMCLLACGHIL